MCWYLKRSVVWTAPFGAGLECWALQSAVSLMPLVPIIKMVRPFFLFVPSSFELWVYWYAKGKKKQTSICSVAQSTFFLNPHSVIWVSHYGIIMIWVWYTVCRKVSIFSRRNTTAPERRGKKGKKGRKSVTSKSRLLLTDIRRHPVDLQCLHSAT